MKTSLVAVLVALVLVAAASPLIAGTGFRNMRCAGKIVSIGDSTMELLQKCGSPVIKEVADGESADVRKLKYYHIVEQWYYDFGRGKFPKIVTIYDGKIVKIESGALH